jgi:hypothetical protein
LSQADFRDPSSFMITDVRKRSASPAKFRDHGGRQGSPHALSVIMIDWQQPPPRSS